MGSHFDMLKVPSVTRERSRQFLIGSHHLMPDPFFPPVFRELKPMNHEQHVTLRVWNPFGFFGDLRVSSPLICGLFALAVVSAFVFLILILRRRTTQFFSLPLFLSLVPFIACSLISYLRFYFVISLIPANSPISGLLVNGILSIQYPLQFGMLSSGVLLFLHTCVYVFCRKTRNAQPV